MNPIHLQLHVVMPTLESMALTHGNDGLQSDAAIRLMMGTIQQESGTNHLTQLGGGPARGLCQVEKATARWLDTKLRTKRYAGLRAYFDDLAMSPPGAQRHDEMCWNLRLAVAYGRFRFWVVKDPLPDESDVKGLAAYWKDHYNTEKGAGTVEQWVKSLRTIESALRRSAA